MVYVEYHCECGCVLPRSSPSIVNKHKASKKHTVFMNGGNEEIFKQMPALQANVTKYTKRGVPPTDNRFSHDKGVLKMYERLS